jgi:hypothetical protein
LGRDVWTRSFDTHRGNAEPLTAPEWPFCSPKCLELSEILGTKRLQFHEAVPIVEPVEEDSVQPEVIRKHKARKLLGV